MFTRYFYNQSIVSNFYTYMFINFGFFFIPVNQFYINPIQFYRQNTEWKAYEGAYFMVKYPSNFKVKNSLPSITSTKGYDSAFFISPDKLVEFYIFSPQWNGEPEDITFNPEREVRVSEKTIHKNSTIVKWYTYKEKNNSYIRSYIDKENTLLNTRFIIGIKYKNKEAYKMYVNQYLTFKNSVIQFGD